MAKRFETLSKYEIVQAVKMLDKCENCEAEGHCTSFGPCGTAFAEWMMEEVEE